MAARLNPQQDERTRSAIRTTQLIHRLEMFTFEENDPQTKKPVKMSGDQVRAAVALLAKTLPDLRATEHSAGSGFTGGFVLVGERVSKDAATWTKDHSPAAK